MLQYSFKVVLRMIEECFEGAEGVYQGSFKGLTRKSQGITLISGISET